MKRLLPLIALTTCLSAFGDSRPDAKTQLRELAEFPSINFTFGYRIDAVEGITFGTADENPEPAIAALEKELRHRPSDAEGYSRLAVLLDRRENGAEAAQAARAEAAKLFRQEVDSHPRDPALLAAFGHALMEGENIDEAEHVLRRGIEIAPSDWHCWSGLGHLLVNKAIMALLGGQSGQDISPMPMLKRILDKHPSADQLQSYRKLMDEGFACHDKAVVLSPNEVLVYQNRGASHCNANLFRMLVSVSDGRTNDLRQMSLAYFEGDGIDDFKAIARLSPTNYQALGLVVLFQAMHETIARGRDEAPWEVWGKYSDAAEKTVRQALSSLRKLGESPDKRLAAEALTTEGFLQVLVLRDLTGSEKTFRHAVDLNPSRGVPWEMLEYVLVSESHYDDLVATAEARLKYQATPRSLFFLAKAETYQNHYEKAEAPLAKALEIAPDDFNANLGMAVVLLRRGDTHSLIKSAGLLERASAALDKAPINDETEQQRLKVYFTSGLYYGLTGLNDKARKVFQTILDHDKDDKDAQAALKAMGNEP